MGEQSLAGGRAHEHFAAVVQAHYRRSEHLAERVSDSVRDVRLSKSPPDCWSTIMPFPFESFESGGFAWTD